MKAKIREMLGRRQQDLPAEPGAATLAVLTSGDSYFTAQQVAERFFIKEKLMIPIILAALTNGKISIW